MLFIFDPGVKKASFWRPSPSAIVIEAHTAALNA